MKISMVVILFLVLVHLSSSLEFGISPSEIKLEGKTNEQICTNFKLIGAENTLFTDGEIVWSEKETKQIADYMFNSQDRGIEVRYPENSFYGEKQICFKVKSSGKYYGAIFYKIHNSSYGIGTWITLDIEGNFFIDKFSRPFITGNYIGNKYETNFLLVIIFFLLLLILFLIIRRTLKRRFSFRN